MLALICSPLRLAVSARPNNDVVMLKSLYSNLQIKTVKDLHTVLTYFKVPNAEFFVRVAMVENGDLLNTDDVSVNRNYFGITTICADDLPFKYSKSYCRYDACYVIFDNNEQACEFMTKWYYKNPPIGAEDLYTWLVYRRRYNPYDYSYIYKLKSRLF